MLSLLLPGPGQEPKPAGMGPDTDLPEFDVFSFWAKPRMWYVSRKLDRSLDVLYSSSR